MVHKVVYNGAYGGYIIPDEVCKKYNEIEGTCYDSAWDMDIVPRHDKLLVELVEEYIKSHDTDLRVYVLKSNRYRIDEYDGWESVMEPHDDMWIVIED